MTPIRAPRWALSFADLCLLLLGFFVLLQARNADRLEVAASIRSALGEDQPAPRGRLYRGDALFQPGEAVLKPAERARLVAIGRRAAGDGTKIRIASTGIGASTHRLDGWELAAARTAAVARAVRQGGLDERRLILVIPQMEGQPKGQVLSVSEVH